MFDNDSLNGHVASFLYTPFFKPFSFFIFLKFALFPAMGSIIFLRLTLGSEIRIQGDF
jgi:hypothetical protein